MFEKKYLPRPQEEVAGSRRWLEGYTVVDEYTREVEVILQQRIGQGMLYGFFVTVGPVVEARLECFGNDCLNVVFVFGVEVSVPLQLCTIVSALPTRGPSTASMNWRFMVFMQGVDPGEWCACNRCAGYAKVGRSVE